MQASSFDIVEMIEAYGDSSGIDLTYGGANGNLFVGKEPSTPKNCVTVFDTSGFAPYLGVSGDVGYEYPSVQVRVRNTKYSTGWNLINSIKNALHGKHQETWNGTLYCVIICSSDPALLDFDDNGNARFVCNFNIQRR
jgi:hypothetical protein